MATPWLEGPIWVTADAWEAHHGVAETDEWDAPIELSQGALAMYLGASMRPNPATTYCKTRRCGHRASLHRDGSCLVDGCECDELREGGG